MITKSIDVLTFEIALLQCDVSVIRTMMNQFVESAGDDDIVYSTYSELDAAVTPADVAQIIDHAYPLKMGDMAEIVNKLNGC